MKIEMKNIGENEFQSQMNGLSSFVLENWDILSEGAKRLKEAEFLPWGGFGRMSERIQIGKVRLHNGDGVKIVDLGGGYTPGSGDQGRWTWHIRKSHGHAPTESHLRMAAQAIQKLLDEAAKTVSCPVKIRIEEI